MILKPPEISVIVPIHNTGKLLHDSIGGMQRQTFSDIEIICVDDNSSDDFTKSIIKSYCDVDARISAIFLGENSGAGGARNAGLRVAKGKYLLFFDSDDYPLPDMLEKMYGLCEKNDLDFCTCCSYTVDAENKGYISSLIYKEKEGVTNRAFTCEELGEEALSYWDTAPWNKLVRSCLVRDNDIFFQEISSCNDVYYSVNCALRAKRIMYCENGNPLVEYRMGRKSQISLNKKPSNLIHVFEGFAEKIDEYSESEKKMLIAELLYLARGELSAKADDKEKEALYEFVINFLKEFSCDSVESELVRLYINKFQTNTFDSRWFEYSGDDINDISGVLDVVANKEEVIIWGYGKNGMKLERALNLHRNKTSVFVADKKNILIGRKTFQGALIISTGDALDKDVPILATNPDVYNYLSAKQQETGKKYELIKAY